jgi:predicted Zn-dependent peptidase
MRPPAFSDLLLEQRRLANGLRVVLNPDPELPLVTVNLWYHVGSRNEARGRTGLAHLFEHMLFQGSQNVGTNDHFRYVQQVGGVANGSTWYDRTNYYETLPSSHLELGLWLEADRMGWLLPAMTAEKLETQRQVVMNERRQRVDNQPYGRAFERLNELLFPPEHPYSWPVIGTMEDIAAATLADVESFFSTWYTPDNTVLTLAGDFDPDRAFELVERYFGEIPGGPRPDQPRPTPLPPAAAARERMPDVVELARLYLAYRLPPYGSDDWYAADLLSSVLTGGRSSPMYRDLVHQRQLVQDVGAFTLPTELVGSFTVVATARPEVDPAVVEAAVREHLAAAASGPCSPEDLERARNRLLTNHCEALQQLDQRADQLSQLTTYFGNPRLLTEELERYATLDAEALRRCAAAWIDAGEGVALTVVPARAGASA